MNCVCFDGCPFILNTLCLEYTGEDLDNYLNIESGATGEEIIQALDNLSEIDQTTFITNASNSIYAVPGGTLGHSPTYHIRINPSSLNLITVSSNGIMITQGTGGDGKVKVDEDDDKDYLEDQFGEESDGIVTITPTTVSGKVRFVPSIDTEALLLEIQENHIDLFCSIITDCIPKSIPS